MSTLAPTIIHRELRGMREAVFAVDGTQLVTVARYVSGWSWPDLTELYRVRPPSFSHMVWHPGGRLGLACGEHCELIDLATGTTQAVMPGSARDAQAVSACGRFVMTGDAELLRVRDLSNAAVVWERNFGDGSVEKVVPLEGGVRWAVLINRGLERGVWQIELWQWPFGGAPLEQFELPYFMCYRAVAAGSLLAFEASPPVPILDLSVGRLVQEIEGPDGVGLGTPCWIPGGGIAIGWHMPRACINVHAGDGTLLHALVPAGHWHGLAANPQSMVLAYHEGFVVVPWAKLEQSDAEQPFAITAPWGEPAHVALDTEEQIEPGEPDLDIHLPLAGVDDAATLRSVLSARCARTAWLPRVRRQRGAVTASKLGGTPFLAQNEGWPNCGVCGQPLQLFLQLNSAELPEELRERFSGLLQVFLCVTDGHATGTCTHGQNPFSKAIFARLCEPSGVPRYSQPPFADAFIESVIESWLPVEDLPASADLELLLDSLNEVQSELMTAADPPMTVQGDKLWGWPAWPQNSDYLNCPRCGDSMDVIFQLASEGALPHNFADAGTAWVHQCREEPDVVFVTWNS
jgi:hypothetical protein